VIETLVPTRPTTHPVAGILRVRGLSVETLAGATGYDPSHLRAVFRHDRPATRRVRAAVSMALGVPADELFDDGDR
jgi:hypothetical protein